MLPRRTGLDCANTPAHVEVWSLHLPLFHRKPTGESAAARWPHPVSCPFRDACRTSACNRVSASVCHTGLPPPQPAPPAARGRVSGPHTRGRQRVAAAGSRLVIPVCDGGVCVCQRKGMRVQLPAAPVPVQVLPRVRTLRSGHRRSSLVSGHRCGRPPCRAILQTRTRAPDFVAPQTTTRRLFERALASAMGCHASVAARGGAAVRAPLTAASCAGGCSRVSRVACTAATTTTHRSHTARRRWHGPRGQ